MYSWTCIARYKTNKGPNNEDKKRIHNNDTQAKHHGIILRALFQKMLVSTARLKPMFFFGISGLIKNKKNYMNACVCAFAKSQMCITSR